jgi:hypothetical protein
MVKQAGRSAPSDTSAFWTRRHYLVATVGIATLAGCAGDDGGDGDGADDGEDGGNGDGEGEELPEGVSEEEFESGPVPDVYVSATSIGGEERNPDELQTKADVQFSEYDEAEENEAHQPGHTCGNCHEYIVDKNGDGFGACAAVEGYIDAADWCVIWEELPEPEVPEGLTEEELATAEVPEEYRTATSLAGEERNPEDLLAQADVRFGESVERIAEGTAAPGQSCATCAEYIPDKNGDGWGACAAVEGYIAVEDWCSVWEKIAEEMG